MTDYENILVSAVRYALGRHTYIVELTCRYIEGLIPTLSKQCKDIMAKDIEAELERTEIYPMDAQKWTRLLIMLNREEIEQKLMEKSSEVE